MIFLKNDCFDCWHSCIRERRYIRWCTSLLAWLPCWACLLAYRPLLPGLLWGTEGLYPRGTLVYILCYPCHWLDQVISSSSLIEMEIEVSCGENRKHILWKLMYHSWQGLMAWTLAEECFLLFAERILKWVLVTSLVKPTLLGVKPINQNSSSDASNSQIQSNGWSNSIYF